MILIPSKTTFHSFRTCTDLELDPFIKFKITFCFFFFFLYLIKPSHLVFIFLCYTASGGPLTRRTVPVLMFRCVMRDRSTLYVVLFTLNSTTSAPSSSHTRMRFCTCTSNGMKQPGAHSHVQSSLLWTWEGAPPCCSDGYGSDVDEEEDASEWECEIDDIDIASSSIHFCTLPPAAAILVFRHDLLKAHLHKWLPRLPLLALLLRFRLYVYCLIICLLWLTRTSPAPDAFSRIRRAPFSRIILSDQTCAVSDIFMHLHQRSTHAAVPACPGLTVFSSVRSGFAFVYTGSVHTPVRDGSVDRRLDALALRFSHYYSQAARNY